jgi:hypothetical protein
MLHLPRQLSASLLPFGASPSTIMLVLCTCVYWCHDPFGIPGQLAVKKVNLKRVVKVEQVPEAAQKVLMRRKSKVVGTALAVRDKAATMLGMKTAVKMKKEVVKRLFMFQMLGIHGFSNIPPTARIRIKIRILTAKVAFSIPYVEDVRRFPAQTASISTFDPAEEVAHVFVQYKSSLRYV